MMRTSVGLRLAMTLAALAAVAPASTVAAQYPASAAQQDQPDLFTVDELDNLLAPIALYPDPILAQVLVAATYPDQLALALRYVNAYGERDIDRQGWDLSVKAVAHYRPVLNMLAEGGDWTVALGQAYALQPGDVMASVQGLREMAYAQGNLVSTSEQRVEYEPRAIRIVPAQTRVIYVPTYDPRVVYYQPVYYARARTSYWSFGIAFPIGAWLAYDVDWGHNDIYYHGWNGYGRKHSWYHVSRPYIAMNTVYVNPYRTVVVINRNIIHHHVTYINFNRYNTVHRQVAWDRRGLPGKGDGARGGRDRGYDDDRRGTPGRRVAEDDKAPRGAPQTNRVTPTRIGGNDRPLYPKTDEGDVSRTARPRSAPDFKPPKSNASQSVSPRTAPAPARTGGTYSPPSRQNGSSAAAPRSGGGYSSPDKAPKANRSSSAGQYTPRGSTSSAPRAMPSRSAPSRALPSRSAPQSAPRSVPQAAPRAPKASSNSAPRASSAPVKSSGKSAAQPSSKASSQGASQGASRGASRPAKPSKGRPDGGA